MKRAVRRSLPPRFAAGRSLVRLGQRRLRPYRLEVRAVEVLGGAADLCCPDQRQGVAFRQHPDVVADLAQLLVQLHRQFAGADLFIRSYRPQDPAPQWVAQGGKQVVCVGAIGGCHGPENIEQTKLIVCRASVCSDQASSRTPPISVKTAVTPPSPRCSSAITCETALIRARWVNACGKLPRWRPLGISSSSA